MEKAVIDDEYRQETKLIRKANRFIDSKFRSSITEQRLTNYCLYELTRGNYTEDDGLRVDVKASTLKGLFQDANEGSFYTKLDTAAKTMTGHIYGYSDPESKVFRYAAVVTEATYEGGVLSVTFNGKLRDDLVALEQQYTQLNLLEMLSYKSPYSSRIAELLESRMYVRKGESPTDKFLIAFNIYEFYITIGLVNAELDAVKKVLNDSKGTEIDFQKAFEVAPEKLYSSVSELKRKVINPCVEEINTNKHNSIYIDDVDYSRSGRGGKITEIKFYVRKKSKKEEKPAVDEKGRISLSSEEMDEFIDELRDLFFEYKLKSKDLRNIAESASWDMDAVKKAGKALENASEVRDVVAWLKSAIRGDWEPAVSKKGRKNAFSEYSERNDYDFDELEKTLIKN